MSQGVNITQIVKPTQHRMGTPKPTGNYGQPADNQPRRHQTVRIHLNRCPIETPLTHLPILITQKQGSDHSPHGVLQIRNQLNRQQRKGCLLFSAHKSGNGDPSLLEPGKQFNGISPVRGNLSITVITTADRTLGPDKG